MSQSHLTLSFPLKSGADARALAQELPPLMPDLFRAEDTIGTVHYSRFTVLVANGRCFSSPTLTGISGRSCSIWRSARGRCSTSSSSM